MKFQYTGNNAKIMQAVSIANQLVANPAFYDQVAACPGFKYSTYTGRQVAHELKNTQIPIIVDAYWNPLSGATAKTQTQININSAKLNRPMPSIVNTVIHESVHFVDWHINQHWDYTDVNDYENPPVSAPYSIGAIAEKMAST